MNIILNRNDNSVEKPYRVLSSKSDLEDRSNSVYLDLTEIFRLIAMKSIFTLPIETDIGGLKINRQETVYKLNNLEEIHKLHQFMEKDDLEPHEANEIIDFFCSLWEHDDKFKITTYPYYGIENKEELEQNLKIFKHYKNPVKINSVWNYYRFKLNEMYNPIKNYILNSYNTQMYRTRNPLIYIMRDNLELKYLMFDDLTVIPNKIDLHYKLPLYK